MQTTSSHGKLRPTTPATTNNSQQRLATASYSQPQPWRDTASQDEPLPATVRHRKTRTATASNDKAKKTTDRHSQKSGATVSQFQLAIEERTATVSNGHPQRAVVSHRQLRPATAIHC